MNHSELAHKWAHAGPDSSRRCGSMSFQGDTLYSYGTPIAKIYRNKNKRATLHPALVLVSEHSYSVSTAKHISHAFRAVSHLESLRVPRYIIGESGTGRYHGGRNAAEDHAVNLEFFANEQARLLKEASRAQSERAVEFRAEQAARVHKAMADYMMFFGIRRKMPALLSFAAAFERARRIENPDPASLDKRERNAARRRELKAAKEARENERRNLVLDPCARTDWRLSGAFDAGGSSYRVPGPCMLRVGDDEIVTSLGARVPLAAAPMVWNLVQRARNAGGYESAGFGKALRSAGRVHIGDYPLDRIDADGTLHAGCHSIPFSELAMMARQLKLEGGANG